MSTPIIYRSSDASAPVLTGTAGDLVNLLDKCLADGYGSKSAAGWTKSFTATNQRSYRQAAGNQFYLDVDDRGASSVLTGASGKEAAVRGYEAMTAVSTGTNPFPTTAQIAAATANWRKSATADSTARGWFLIADDRSFILGILDGDAANNYKLYIFGDVYSLKTGDGFRTGVVVRTVVNSTATTGSFPTLAVQLAVVSAGFYMARTAAGTGTSMNASYGAAGSAWDATLSFTSALDGNLYLVRVLVGDLTASVLRGWLRGLYEVIGAAGLGDGDTFSGAGDLAGRTFVVVKNFFGGNNALAVETTTWDTSS